MKLMIVLVVIVGLFGVISCVSEEAEPVAATEPTATADSTISPSLTETVALSPVSPPELTSPSDVISCTVFATREGLVGETTANGHVIQASDRFVALPSKEVLASKDGYEYQVRITYRNKAVTVPIWDVGPWNTDDGYWYGPDRPFGRDLPQCLPESQAAFETGYNDGKDEFGRKVANPSGIDLADGTWADLGMTDNDWVIVEFLWTGIFEPWLYKVDVNDVAGIAVTHNEKKSSYRLKGDQWVCAESKDAPVRIERWAGYPLLVSGPLAQHIMAKIDDSSKYGLDQPQTVLEVGVKEGQSVTIHLGDSTGDQRYARLIGEERLFLVAAIWAETIENLALTAEPSYPCP